MSMSDHDEYRVEGPDRAGLRMTGLVRFGGAVREIEYTEIDGEAYVEGDIILGPAASIRRGTFVELARKLAQRATGATGRTAIRELVSSGRRALLTDLRVLVQERAMVTIDRAAEIDEVLAEVADGDTELLEGVVHASDQRRWPGGEIPFRIASNLEHPQRVIGAIAHWHAAEAGIKFRKVVAGDKNYIVFAPSTEGSSSSVGMIGGGQTIYVGPTALQGNVIHEIGHAVGMWHEQSREDRDFYVLVNYANVKPGHEHNFKQRIHEGDDVGPYDFGSIMHYPRYAFAGNPNVPTITPRKPYADHAAVMGQRSGLSQGDIDAVRFMYKYTPAAQNNE